ncbi:bifunctional 3-hydroxydecanoyl-ACP dehydratase/trans-2-decenoyl-ACP isomerase [Spirochaeta africana]|uniref:3-hydroxymyristoyl/3-hydroxydecanoyl-(Acyl carrier protein) dehydratase n=1 Tax=Spirochaeta africana (strain ATCC 700263 / DSM 8902 / Z-7692) TaxID=889378 RepID=H9ULC4_SPIAZ|nr:bifunctional 3-hydroxydecanoyl-ACP dehydratase/trans-2-decenoyl-ACP isomerase [Spirochaeta africana]AFG38317.1 3-hydroxymyristoyl/3-hydroxydecanoyl-(acyl carrier protein) dehydratase [Spirochaeta africana DSM 8902]
MKYADYLQKSSLNKEEIMALAWGSLVEDPPEGGLACLPAPPMLMIDRIPVIEHDGNRGRIVAEQDVQLDAWFFQCHFRNDPVQPGCLGVDAVWQLIGLYAGLRGAQGYGRALGIKEIEFQGQIRPHNEVVRYEVAIRRYADLPASGSAVAIGNAEVFVDDELIYTMKDAKVGIFKGIQYADYPHHSPQSRGGKM